MERREFLSLGIVTAAASAGGASAQIPTDASARTSDARRRPGYTLSINIELMFPREMLRADRIRTVARHGVKAFGFWQPVSADEERGMLQAQQETGLACSIANGSGPTGGTTGFTTPGYETEYFEQLRTGLERAHRFGASYANTFVGLYRADVPWLEQRRLILEGLKRAADMARKLDVIITLEPLYRAGPKRAAIHTAETAFDLVDALADPHIKVCFDVYHLQLTEGNLTNNLRMGLEKDWIRIVQSGDVPGRKEPGTGEINHAHLFKTLREIGYKGYLDTEHGTTTTADETIELCKSMVSQS